MFSNTLKGIKADFKPMYVKTRSAGTAWLDTSRKYVSQKMHKAANMLDVHPARQRELLLYITTGCHSLTSFARYLYPVHCLPTRRHVWDLIFGVDDSLPLLLLEQTEGFPS